MSTDIDHDDSALSCGDDAAPPPSATGDDRTAAPAHDSSQLSPFLVGRPRLTGSDRVGLVLGAMLLVAMFAVPLSLVRSHTVQGRDLLNERLAERAELGASFVEEFVGDLTDRARERATANLVGATDPSAAFRQAVDAFSFDAALELDEAGRVVHIWPHREDLIGTAASPTYVHLTTALDGDVGVSDVVPSAAQAEPVVAIAVPFDTPQGRHVFSGAFAATDSQLANYFDAAVPPGGGQAYLVDASNTIIVASTSTSTSTSDGSDLTSAQLAAVDEGLSTPTLDGTASIAFRAPIDGTPWDVILVTSSANLYEPVEAGVWHTTLLLALLTLACLGAFVLLVHLARARAASVAASTAHQKQAAMLRSVIQTDQSLIYVKDLDGKYLLANPAFLRAFEVSEAELLGETDDYLDPAMAPIWQANDLRARDGLYETEEQSTGSSGVMTYESRKFPLHDLDGSVYAICGVSLDVTERRRSAQAAEHARDAALIAAAVQRDFTAAASHELRTPTTSIIGFVEEVLASDNQNEEDTEFLHIVQRNAHRLSRLIDDLLIIGQSDASAPLTGQESTDLCNLVDDVMSTFSTAANSRGVDLILSCAPDLPRITVDPLRIEQALTNLVSNAIKFTPPGGNVEITIEVVTGSPELVQVSISDTGIGVEAGELDRIFDRFYRSRTALAHAVKGTGLGLPIAKAMIEADGGHITVASTVGEGTTFTVTLPTGQPT